MALPDLPGYLDYNDGSPQTTLKGRRWTAEVAFYLAVEASPELVEDLLADLLGGTCVQPEHPLYDVGLADPVAISARVNRGFVVTDWSAQNGGCRTGHNRFVDDGVPA